MSAPFLFGDPPGELKPLFPHQERALDLLRDSLRSGHKRPLLMAPTGFGKTVVSAHIIQRALDKGKRVAFVVPALSLIDQSAQSFYAQGIRDLGVMQGSHPLTDMTAPLQICSVQTLARRQKPKVDLLLIDEAHLKFDSLYEWIESPEMADVVCVGLSATPGSKGLGQHYDDLLIATTTRELIERGFLAPFKVFAPSVPDLSRVHTVAGDYHQGELSEACNKPQLVGDVIKTWLERGENRPTLCYGVDCAHAQHLQSRFVEAGVIAGYIDAYTERPDRERIFERFRAGEVRVITNVATLTTGLDLPMVSCLIDAKPTKSEMLFVQTIGRGLRTHPGKENCIVLDHAGNTLRLGLVTDIHFDKLDDGKPRKSGDEGKKEKREPLPRLCDECKSVVPRHVENCPECGAVLLRKTTVRHSDEHLVEYGSNKSGKRKPRSEDMAAFHGELKFIAKQRGYAPGWAARQYKEHFGEWPNGLTVKTAEPREPTIATRNWVRSRQIAFAKARARHG